MKHRSELIQVTFYRAGIAIYQTYKLKVSLRKVGVGREMDSGYLLVSGTYKLHMLESTEFPTFESFAKYLPPGIKPEKYCTPSNNNARENVQVPCP